MEDNSGIKVVVGSAIIVALVFWAINTFSPYVITWQLYPVFFGLLIIYLMPKIQGPAKQT
ncbi:Uncharacterised protein [uncultured archaeon]|nr:Uncharacterised protein [uncultured archaeon]